MRRQFLISLMVLAGLMTVYGPVLAAPAAEDAPDTQAATRFIRDLADETLKIVQKDDTPPAARDKEFAELLDKGVNTRYMSRFVLGRNWHKASDAQREEFSRLFREFLLENLTDRLSGEYDSNTFVIRGGIAAGSRDVLVRSEVQRRQGPTLPVEWRVRQFDGEWQIIDLKAEGVSLLITHREEFASVVQRKGIEGLLASLRDKVETIKGGEEGAASRQARTTSDEATESSQNTD